LFGDVARHLGRLNRRQRKAAVADQHILGLQEVFGLGDQRLNQPVFRRLGGVDAQQAQGQEQALFADLPYPADDAEHDRRQGFARLMIVVLARTVLEPGPPETGRVHRHRTVAVVIPHLPLPSAAQGRFPVDQQLANRPSALP